MAIHAQRTAFRSSAQFPDFSVTSPLDPGQVLIYDDKAKAFVNKSQACLTGVPHPESGGGGGGGTITGGINLGSGSEVFKDVLLTDFRFRTVAGGPGITIDEDGFNANTITVVNDIINDACISVPDSFKLEIDNNGDTTNTAKFEIFSFRSGSSASLIPINATFPAFDIQVVTDPAFINPGQFISQSLDFDALGFVAGMCLSVEGTDEQDGVFKIASISTTNSLNDTITITIPFPNATDAGLQGSVTMEGLFFEVLTIQSFQAIGTDWAALGFMVGQTIDIVGTTDNDGAFTISSISNDIITILEALPGTVGCDVASITVQVPPNALSTGWWVTELGEMKTQDTDICGDLNVTGDAVIVGDLTVGGVDLDTIIFNLLPVFPNNGLLVQTSSGVFDARGIIGTNGITVTDGDGLAGNPSIAADDFDITLLGDIAGSGTVTGLTNTLITTTLPVITVAGTFNEVTINAKGQVVSGANAALDFQPASVILDNLNDGMDNPGIVVWDGSDYIDRTIIGTANEIEVLNGTGAVGNPQIGIVDDPIIPGTEAMLIPRGLTVQQPSSPAEGMLRYNQTDDRFEGFHDSTWDQFAHLDDLVVFLPLAGGTMAGDIDMNSNNITFGTGLVDGRDVSADGALLDNINTGTGIKVQTAPDTFVNRSIDVETNEPLTVTDGNGVAGDPTLGFDITQVPDLVGVIDQEDDLFLLHDSSTGTTRKATLRDLDRPAFRYFFAQI